MQRAANRLIDGLPRTERDRVLQHGEQVDLAVGSVLCEPALRFRHVYFPITGLVSLVATVRGEQPLEIAMVGNEGMLGVTLVLGIGVAPLRAVVQVSGSALRFSTPQIRQELHDNPALLRTLNRYLYVQMTQLSRTVACTRFHVVEARLARCLLMAHDRSQSNHFRLTHRRLSDILGVQRSAVSIAASALQKRRLIDYVRGRITILSRGGLEAASCDCYAAVVDDYFRLLP